MSQFDGYININEAVTRCRPKHSQHHPMGALFYKACLVSKCLSLKVKGIYRLRAVVFIISLDVMKHAKVNS